jgi:hypothetical protein
MTEVKLTKSQIQQLLYYETGFEQLHPDPAIIDWMEQQGWRYHNDWNCVRVDNTWEERNYYKLVFADDEMASVFLLKWL